jgi:hypothetical protein
MVGQRSCYFNGKLCLSFSFSSFRRLTFQKIRDFFPGEAAPGGSNGRGDLYYDNGRRERGALYKSVGSFIGKRLGSEDGTGVLEGRMFELC